MSLKDKAGMVAVCVVWPFMVLGMYLWHAPRYVYYGIGRLAVRGKQGRNPLGSIVINFNTPDERARFMFEMFKFQAAREFDYKVADTFPDLYLYNLTREEASRLIQLAQTGQEPISFHFIDNEVE